MCLEAYCLVITIRTSNAVLSFQVLDPLHFQCLIHFIFSFYLNFEIFKGHFQNAFPVLTEVGWTASSQQKVSLQNLKEASRNWSITLHTTHISQCNQHAGSQGEHQGGIQ